MKLDALIKDTESLESYKLFREIENWCVDNIPKDKWRFQYSPTICVCGVDIPGRIIFKRKEDLEAFLYRFSECLHPGSI